MNAPAHYWAIYCMLMHLMMGVSGLLGYGPQPPSWATLYYFVPGTEWIHPFAYIITGVLFGIGIKNIRILGISYLMSGSLFLAWCLLGLVSMSRGTGGNLQGASANLYVTGWCILGWYYLRRGTRSDRIDQKVSDIQDEIDKS